ncbi:MAG: UDP-N-acetylmuramate dehydrogenase [Polyangiaceae bacterium]
MTKIFLRDRTTIGVGGPARRFEEATTDLHVEQLCREAREQHERVLILGGGSNLVVADAGVDACVIAMATRGIEQRIDGDSVELDVAAGEPWDAFVERTVNDGLCGLECLSGIPGLVGATPIQNVGAYGQEAGDRIVSVHLLDRRDGSRVMKPSAWCEFGYRDSVLKRHPDDFVVLGVTFRLRRGSVDEPRYGELREALRQDGERWRGEQGQRVIRDKVIELRARKGMVLNPNDPDSKSAGSFFMNPIVPVEQARTVELRARELGALRDGEKMPEFAASEGFVKLAAGWLIERAGFQRGMRRGQAAISSRHALALVNLGGATAREIMLLAAEIQRGVLDRFGVALEPEPVRVGF